MKHTYIWDREQQRLVEVYPQPPQPRIHIIGDAIPAFWHHGVDMPCDSRSKSEEYNKASGCVVKEGRIAPKQKGPKPGEVREAVRASVSKLLYKN